MKPDFSDYGTKKEIQKEYGIEVKEGWQHTQDKRNWCLIVPLGLNFYRIYVWNGFSANFNPRTEFKRVAELPIRSENMP